MPDIGDRIRLTLDGLDLQGGGYLQSYRLAGRGFDPAEGGDNLCRQ